MSDDLPVRFSDEHARAILARAIEIDARNPMTTIDDLRAIALEIGVSPASLEAALREQATSIETRRQAAGRRATMVLTGLGVPLGVAAGLLLGSGAILPALGIRAVGLLASAGLVVFHGDSGSLRSFHLKNLTLWGGVFAGSVAAMTLLGVEASVSPALITAGWCLRSWVASSILGSAAVLAVRRARRQEGAGAGTAAPNAAAPASGSRWTRITGRLRDLLGSPSWIQSFRLTA